MGLVPIRVFVFVVFFLHYFFLLPIVHYKYWIELKLTVSKQGGGGALDSLCATWVLRAVFFSGLPSNSSVDRNKIPYPFVVPTLP